MSTSLPARTARRASEVEGRTFPYAARDVCFIEHSDGMIRGQVHTKPERADAIGRARLGQSTIYAVWPGQFRSDLFWIDDLDALAEAWKLP